MAAESSRWLASISMETLSDILRPESWGHLRDIKNKTFMDSKKQQNWTSISLLFMKQPGTDKQRQIPRELLASTVTAPETI